MVVLVRLEQQEEQAAVTVALVQRISQAFMRVAAVAVDYSTLMETVRADLAVVVMAVAEREQTALAVAAAARLQIFQVRQVHQQQEKVEMVLLSFVIQERQLVLLVVQQTRQRRRAVLPSILSLNPETW